jgi:hypothetical protein
VQHHSAVIEHLGRPGAAPVPGCRSSPGAAADRLGARDPTGIAHAVRAGAARPAALAALAALIEPRTPSAVITMNITMQGNRS